MPPCTIKRRRMLQLTNHMVIRRKRERESGYGLDHAGIGLYIYIYIYSAWWDNFVESRRSGRRILEWEARDKHTSELTLYYVSGECIWVIYN
jgi:hypothetical protein